MLIRVRLFGPFGPAAQQGQERLVELKEGSRVSDLVAKLGLPAGKPMILLLNGKPCHGQAAVEDEDSLSIFPVMIGG